MQKKVLAVLLVLAFSLSAFTVAAPLSATTVVNSARMDYGPTGWAGWSCPSTHPFIVSGEVVAVTPPLLPMTTEVLWKPGATTGASTYPLTPFGYSYGVGEQGFIAQNGPTGQSAILRLTCSTAAPVVDPPPATNPAICPAGQFSVLAAEAVTNTGPSTTSGDVGVYPGTSIDGGIEVGGEIHSADAVAGAAQSVASAAHVDLRDPMGAALGVELGGLTLTPGTYTAGNFTLNGTLYLSPGVYIFNAATTINMGDTASIEGGDSCNLWWTAGSDITFEVGSTGVGTYIAGTSVVMKTGASLDGRVWALTGNVTLDSVDIDGSLCGCGGDTPPGPDENGVCVETPLYYQFTLTRENSPTCYLVSWDTKDEIGKPDEFWIPRVESQICNCSWNDVADNVPYGGWVTRDCNGNIKYDGRIWMFYKPYLQKPHWSAPCIPAIGGGGGECYPDAK